MTIENTVQRPSAFVIMPFASEFESIYFSLIKPALEEVGYEVTRADSNIDQQNILRKIIKGITTAKLIVAELTTLNPNVLYELGLAHGLEIPTVLLAQSINEIPFDLRSYNIQIYSTHFNEIGKLKESLKEIGKKRLENKIIFGSPVTDFAPQKTRDNSYNAIEGTLSQSYEENSMGEDYGILEAQQASEGLAQVMIAMAGEINNSVKEISPLLDRFDDVTHQPDIGKMSEAQKLAEQISIALNDSSKRLEVYVPEIESKIGIPFQVLVKYLNTLSAKDHENTAQLENFRRTFLELSDKLPLALKKIHSYKNSVIQIGLRSNLIGQASKRNSQAIEKLADIMVKIQSFISRALQIIDEKMNTT